MTRVGRWLTRILGWMIAVPASVAAVLVLGVAGYLAFSDYEEALRQGLESQLAELSGGHATIGSIDLDITRFAVELGGISVVPTDGEEPVLEVERVLGRLRIAEALRLRVYWTELRVEGLVLRLERGGDAGPTLPLAGRLGAAARSSPASSAVAVSADRVALVDSTVIIHDVRVPWTLEAEGVDLEMQREWGRGLKGRLEVGSGRFRLQDRLRAAASLRADFEWLAPDVFLNRFEAESDLGSAEARGKLSLTPRGPEGRFDVSVEARPREAAAALLADRAVHVDGEPLRFRGQLDVTPESRTLQGTVVWDEGLVAGAPLSRWSGELFWDDQLFQVSSARGLLAGGVVRAQLDQPLPATEHDGSLELDARDVSLQRLVLGVARAESPLASRLAGRGSFAFSLDGPWRLRGPFELRGDAPTPVPPSSGGAGADALDFHARGRLRAGDVELEEGAFSTPTLSGTLRGRYPRAGEANLELEARSTDLAATDRLQRDLRRLLRPDEDDEDDEERTPELWGVAGEGRARGRLRARLPHLRYEGELAAERLRFEGVDWGGLRARGRISREEIAFEDLNAEKGDSAVRGRGRVALAGPLGRRDFDVDVSLSRWPGADLATLLAGAGFASGPVTGPVTGRVAARRVDEALSGSARLDVSRGTLFGESFDSAEVKLVLEGTRMRVEAVSVVREGSPLEGSVVFDLRTGAMSGSLTTSGFPLRERLSKEAEAEPGKNAYALSGLVAGRLDLSGSVEDPAAEFRGVARALRLGEEELGEADVEIELLGKRVRINVALARDHSTLELTAETRLDSGRPVTARLRWNELDLAPWLRTGSETSETTIRVLSNGEAHLRGTLNRPRSLSGEATLDQLVVESGDVRVASLTPVKLGLDEGRLRVESFELARGPSRVRVGGGVDVEEGHLDLRADGMLSLGILEMLYPGFATSGDMSLAARVRGTWRQPSLSGQAELLGGSLRLEGFPQALGDLKGRLVFDNRTVRFSDVRGVFGSGPVRLQGALSWEGARAGSVDLRLEGTNVRLRYPEGFTATLGFDLAVVGSSQEQVLSGRVSLEDALWTREYDLVSGILSDPDGLRLFEELAEQSLFDGLRFDVRIRGDDSRVRNSIATIDGTADLNLRGSFAEPALLGGWAAERGDVFFLGQRYVITSGRVDFVDPMSIEPFVDLTAETRVRNYRVELRLTGTPERFFPELSSDPPLRTVDILRLLAGATERDILLGTEAEEVAGVGVASLLTERLTQEVGRRAERLFGLDRFSIDPFLVGRFANPTARVSLGKRIRRDLSINYSTNLNATTEAIILIEYTPEGPVSWILSRDEEGDVGIDVKFRRSF